MSSSGEINFLVSESNENTPTQGINKTNESLPNPEPFLRQQRDSVGVLKMSGDANSPKGSSDAISLPQHSTSHHSPPNSHVQRNEDSNDSSSSPETQSSNINSSNSKKNGVHTPTKQNKKKRGGRGKKNRPKMVTLRMDESLGFRYRQRPVYHAPKTKNYGRLSRHFSKEQYVQANFRFLVSPEADLNSSNVSWTDIVKVYLTVDPSFNCPICLELEMCAPVLTKCGHVFCSTCLVHYLSESKKAWRRCPLCSESVHWSHCHFVVQDVKKLVTTGGTLDMRLLYRGEGITDYSFIRTSDHSEAQDAMLFEKDFRRIRRLKNSEGLFSHELAQLYSRLESAHPVFERPYLGMVEERIHAETLKWATALASQPETRDNFNIHITPSPTKKTTLTQERWLYQSMDGQRVFLDSLNHKCLNLQFPHGLPPKISGKILALTMVTLSAEERKKYRFLSHLPLNASVVFAELDLDHLFDDASLETHGEEIQARRRRRLDEIRAAERNARRVEEMAERRRILRIADLPMASDFPELRLPGAEFKDEAKFPSLRAEEETPEKKSMSEQEETPIATPGLNAWFNTQKKKKSKTPPKRNSLPKRSDWVDLSRANLRKQNSNSTNGKGKNNLTAQQSTPPGSPNLKALGGKKGGKKKGRRKRLKGTVIRIA